MKNSNIFKYNLKLRILEKILRCILQDFKISIDYFGSIENFDNIE